MNSGKMSKTLVLAGVLLIFMIIGIAASPPMLTPPDFSRNFSFTATGTTTGVDVSGNGLVAYKLIWSNQASVLPSACTITLETSRDNVNWTAAAISGTCTTDGQSAVTNIVTSFVRLNLTAYTAASSPSRLTVAIAGLSDGNTQMVVGSSSTSGTIVIASNAAGSDTVPDFPFYVNSPSSANPLGTMPHVFNGTTWSRLRGDTVGMITHGTLSGVRCNLTATTATTLTLVTGCSAPGASTSIYITDIVTSANADAIGADAHNTLKFGTGGSCGTGTTTIYDVMTPAAALSAVSDHFITPLKVTANNEVCFINSTAGTKSVVISGFLAPG